MSWYTTGSVNLTNGSKTVTGVGTKWTNPLIGICAGQMLILKPTDTIEICEIASVQSDTQLTLANKYEGVTKTVVNYEIPTVPNVSVEHLALRISEMLNYYQQQMEGWQTVLTGEGEVTLTAPDGRIVTIKSQYSIQNELIKLVEKGKNFSEIAIQNAELSNNASQSAKNSESSAKTSADNAAKFADSASQSAKNAGNSATSAKTAETGAQTSATEAKQSALDAKNWASTVDTTTFVKKSGDTMTGNLSVKDKISILNKSNNGLILHAQDNTNNFLFLFVNDGKSDYKMAYNRERNSIEFRALDDVKINSKSVLKTGDAVNFGGNLLNKNLNELTGLSAGIYFQNSNSLATTQNGYPVKEAGDLQVIQNGAEGKEGCSQIYTTYRNVRQFIRNYRPSLKTWEAWVEQITTANASADIVGALPAVKTGANNAPIYKVGNQVDFDVKPKINGIEPIYIVESYVNGNNWYNVYSNGFIEQSSALKINTPNQYAVCGTLINLLKPMKTQNYGVSIDKICGNAPWAQTEFAHAELDTTAFWLASYSSIVGECWVRWTVRGY